MIYGIKNPLVSIIVTVYNVEKYISRCIQSICNQTYSNIEILLINDENAPDNSRQICMDYKKNDNRIRVIDKKKGNLSSSRNEGLNNANGEYVCFIDGDDYISPYYIEKMLYSSYANNSDLVLCDYEVVDSTGNKIDVLSNGQQYNKIDLFSNISVMPVYVEKLYYKNRHHCAAYTMSWNKLYRKSIFKRLRFNEDLYTCEDEYIFSDLLRECKKISFIPNKLYYYVQTNIGLSTKNKSDSGFNNITAVFDHRINTYVKEHNFELQTLCCNKYLRQIISHYIFLSKPEKKKVIIKYLTILKKYPASKIFYFFYPAIPLLSFLKNKL